MNLGHWRVTGCSSDRTHCEPGLGIETSLLDALSLARQFGQEAIFWIVERDLFVVSCNSGTEIPIGRWETKLS